MAGTIEGGKKAAAKNKELYGSDFYARIGAEGGKRNFKDHGVLKGFALNSDRARTAGQIGGRKSKRPKAVSNETQESN